MFLLNYKKFRTSIHSFKMQFIVIQTILCACVIFTTACEKYNYAPENQQYPTTVRKLNSTEYNNAIISYFARNPDITSALNEFGFCDYSETYDREYSFPPKNGYISQDQVVTLARDFIARNPTETGMRNPSLVSFYNISQMWGYDSACIWNLRISTQFVNSMEVMNTDGILEIVNSKITLFVGNWYPEIYIPDKFNITPEKALQSLVGKECGIWGWGGYNSNKVKQSDLNNAQVDKVIYPVSDGSADHPETNTKTELRVAYKIYLPDAFYIFYIDVMDGRLISSEPTIIS